MIKDGDAKEGRSVNSVQCCNEDKDFNNNNNDNNNNNIFI